MADQVAICRAPIFTSAALAGECLLTIGEEGLTAWRDPAAPGVPEAGEPPGRGSPRASSHTPSGDPRGVGVSSCVIPQPGEEVSADRIVKAGESSTFRTHNSPPRMGGSAGGGEAGQVADGPGVAVSNDFFLRFRLTWPMSVPDFARRLRPLGRPRAPPGSLSGSARFTLGRFPSLLPRLRGLAGAFAALPGSPCTRPLARRPGCPAGGECALRGAPIAILAVAPLTARGARVPPNGMRPILPPGEIVMASPCETFPTRPARRVDIGSKSELPTTAQLAGS